MPSAIDVTSTLFKDASNILNEMAGIVTGRKANAPQNLGDFVNVATTVQAYGFEPIMNAISLMVNRTIFSSRTYTPRLGGLLRDEAIYGAITRKIKFGDLPFVEDVGFTLTDGQSIDQYIIRKPKAMQLNIYGQTPYSDFQTFWEEQTNASFTGPEQFSAFWAANMTQIYAKHSQKTESEMRLTLSNHMLGTSQDETRVFNLFTMWKEERTDITADNPYSLPANDFREFVQFAISRIEFVTTMMKERTGMYQTNITGFEYNQHTPAEYQHIFLNADFMSRARNMAYSNMFDSAAMFKVPGYEEVAFWQSPLNTMQVMGTPKVLKADGTTEVASAPITIDNVIGFVADRDALGVSIINDGKALRTPINARGRYSNVFWSWNYGHWNDFTEKAVLFTLN